VVAGHALANKERVIYVPLLNQKQKRSTKQTQGNFRVLQIKDLVNIYLENIHSRN
jgi:hypothetical protein